MSDRIRLALLSAVVAAVLAAPCGAALASPRHGHAARSIAVGIAVREARIARFARRLVGTRYSYGGTSPSTGFDCSGFTRFVYAHFGLALPHYSAAQFELGRRVSRAALRPGDLVFFDGLGHVGLYLGGGAFVHAPHSGSSVTVDSLDGWYASRYDGARRLV